MGLSMATAGMWVERWERQQRRYALDREERFAVIADATEHLCADRDRPLLLDLGCGPGSLSVRLARRLPEAEIVAVDMDPVLLELGRTHHADAARYVDAVIGEDGWTDALQLERNVDVAVTTTALHYLPAEVLLRTYRALATLLRPGGALVNGDHFPPDGAPCSDLTAHVGLRRAERTVAHGPEDEDWGRGGGPLPPTRSWPICSSSARRGIRPPVTATSTSRWSVTPNCSVGRGSPMSRRCGRSGTAAYWWLRRTDAHPGARLVGDGHRAMLMRISSRSSPGARRSTPGHRPTSVHPAFR